MKKKRSNWNPAYEELITLVVAAAGGRRGHDMFITALWVVLLPTTKAEPPQCHNGP